MKMLNLILVAMALTSIVAVAQARSIMPMQRPLVTLTEDETAVYPIQNPRLATVFTTYPNCPPGAICEPMAVARISLPLNGCVDRLAGASVSIQDVVVEGVRKREVTVLGFGIENKQSKVVRCIRQAEGIIEVALGFSAQKENVIVKSAYFFQTPTVRHNR